MLLAIKQAVDEDNRPGQFLLTGSSDVLTSPVAIESLAGRTHRIRLRPLTQGEMRSVSPGFLPAAFEQTFVRKKRPAAENRKELLELALRGGFPEPATLGYLRRRQWYDNYIESLLQRDLKDISRIRRYGALRDLVAVLAAWSGKCMNVSAIGAALSMQRSTLYLSSVPSLGSPAWGNPLDSRLKMSGMTEGDSCRPRSPSCHSRSL